MENKAKKGVFQKYYSRLKGEGILLSVICALVVGFATQFLTAFGLWFTKGVILFWISIIVGVGIAGILSPIFYYTKFRPTAKSIARRIDRLGLEERLITMTELEQDDSYIAFRQREDAKLQLEAVEKKRIKFKVSQKLIVASSFLAFFAVGMTTVDALTDYGIIKTPDQLIEDIVPAPIEYVELTYLTEGNGFIEGEDAQIIEKGTNGTLVVAVEDEGWVFVKWSDGLKNPARRDLEVMKDKQITAQFGYLQEEEGGQGGGKPGEGEPSDGDEPKESEEPSNDDPGNGASGKFEETNHVIDGKTYYRDIYEQYLAEAERILAEGGEIPQELKDAIALYFQIIK